MVLAVGPAALAAQAPRPSSKPVTPPPDPQQIAAAVLAVPTEFRTGARVLGYHAGSARLVTLREGTGPFVCLASDPAGSRFHVACYISRSSRSWRAAVRFAPRVSPAIAWTVSGSR